MNLGKLLAGILVGAAAGAVLGILFAPEKGTEARKRIAETGADFAGSVKDKYNEYADVISDKYDMAKQKLSELVSGENDTSADPMNPLKNEQTEGKSM